MKDKTFELAERLADEAFGSKGVIEYSSRQELTVKFYEMLKETSIELYRTERKTHRSFSPVGCKRLLLHLHFKRLKKMIDDTKQG